MPTFKYVAHATGGQSSTGILTATSRIEVLHALQERRLTPLSLEEVSNQTRWQMRVPKGAIVNALNAMADLLESGLPLLKSLELVANQATHPRLKTALRETRDRVADGESLAVAMKSHPQVFDELSTSMIAVGEEGGFLEDTLQRVARLTERQAEVRSHLLTALAYPTFLLITGLVVCIGMMLYFVPLFEPLFERMRERGELPLATEVLLSASNSMRHHTILLLIIVASLTATVRLWVKSDAGRSIWDRTKLRVVGVGPIFRDILIARFSHVLGTLLSNGVPMLRSLEMAERAVGNQVMAQAVHDARDAVAAGGSLAEPLAQSGLFPPDTSETIAMGEHANRLEQVLMTLAARLERRAQKQLDLFTKMLEPILMTVLAALIGFLIVALLMPIFASSGRLQ